MLWPKPKQEIMIMQTSAELDQIKGLILKQGFEKFTTIEKLIISHFVDHGAFFLLPILMWGCRVQLAKVPKEVGVLSDYLTDFLLLLYYTNECQSYLQLFIVL